MFAKLFALFFGKKEEPKPTVTIAQRMEQRRTRDMYGSAVPLRTSKAGSARAPTTSTRREDDIMSNPIHPLNPLNPIGFNSSIYHDSTPSHSSNSSPSYDCGSSSSSSSYDSSSSSCDSSSSSSSD